MSDRPPAGGRATAIGLAIGGGAGAILFAATANPVWIGVFAALGAAVGESLGRGGHN